MLASEEYGKDLASVQNLAKKHQLLEADIAAHEDRIKVLTHRHDGLAYERQNMNETPVCYMSYVEVSMV